MLLQWRCRSFVTVHGVKSRVEKPVQLSSIYLFLVPCLNIYNVDFHKVHQQTRRGSAITSIIGCDMLPRARIFKMTVYKTSHNLGSEIKLWLAKLQFGCMLCLPRSFQNSVLPSLVGESL